MKKIRNNHKLGLLRDIFYSHPQNNHKPHILRGITLIIISSIAVFLMGVSFARYYLLHETVLGQEIVSSVLIDLTNETRISYGESPLLRSKKLEDAASYKAEDMSKYEYFAHNSPTGVTPWFWIKKVGYDFLYAGENLAIDFTESKDVEDAWMKSPTHKANILNNKFKEIGISTREGLFNGHNTIYVVQMFGTPKDIENSEDKKVVESESSTHQESTKSLDKVNLNGEVAGINTTSKEEETKSNISSDNNIKEYTTILDKDNMIIVANKSELDSVDTQKSLIDTVDTQDMVKYSNFWQKFIYNFWYDLNLIYKCIVFTIVLALFLLFFTEFRRHHWLHIFYGALTIMLMIILLYINQSLW